MTDDTKAIATTQPAALTVEGEASSLLSVIARAAQDPTVDPAKMRELLQLQRDVMADHARAAYRAALARLQAELGDVTITKGGLNAHTKTRYAKLEDIDRQVRPVCARHGFAFTFDSTPGPNGITYTCEMSHDGGHAETRTLTLPVDAGAGRNAVQAVGSTTSYARRYLLGMHLNLVARDEDDDGNGGPHFITAAQAADLRAKLAEVKGDEARFLRHFRAETFEGISERSLGEALRMIADKGKGAKR